MDDYISARVRLAIREDIIDGEDWTNCHLLDDLKKKFPECSAGDVDALYMEELRAKVVSLPEAELKALLQDQCAVAPANQNRCLLTLVRAKLG